MKVPERIVAWILLLAAGLAPTVSIEGKPLSQSGAANLVGDWVGQSICVGYRPACHDEQVVFHIAKAPDAAGKVTIAADKIISGKAEEMWTLEFKFDAAKHTLINEFTRGNTHGRWEFTVKGNTLEGTLVILPDKSIGRRVKLKKKAAPEKQA